MIFSYVTFSTFYPIFTAKEIIITYGIHPFDICSKNSDLWQLLKIIYIICSLFSHLILGHLIYTRIFRKIPFFGTSSTRIKNEQHLNGWKKDSLCFLIGVNLSH